MRASIVLTCLLAVAIAAPACHSHDDAPAAAVVAGAPAGDVTEVAGDVHATRDGKTRALGKGDVVSGDDVIATGADGRVTIVLRHNQVPWSLGPNKQKKVADSAAWTAAKGASGEVVSDDKSGAAGRHAERVAAETEATGSGSAENAADKRADDQEATEERAKEQAQQAEQKAAAEKATAEAPKGGHALPCTCVAGDPLCSCLGGDDVVKAKIDGEAPGGGEVEGALDPQTIQRVMKAHAHDFTRCYETLLKQAPTAAGKLRLRLTIAKSGKVTKVELDGDAALAPMYDCVRAAANTLRFPAPSSEISVMYPLVFTAAN